MREIQKVALVLGSNPAVDRDAIGPYTEQLHKYMTLVLEETTGPDLDIDLVPFRPRSTKEWTKGFVDMFRSYDLVHIEYPFEGWGTSVAPGLLPGLLSLIHPYRKTKLVTTLHEWRIMHPLRKASILPLALRSHGTLFVSNREHDAFRAGPCYRLRSRKPLTDVIPLGGIVPIPELSTEEVLDTRHRLLNWNGFGVDILLGYFGFIYAAKQPDKMLRTLAALLERGIRTRLVIAGDFMADHVAAKESFFNSIETLELRDNVAYLGFVEDEAELARVLSACNAVLLLFSDGVSARRTSFWTVLELGVPVITTEASFEGEFDNLLEPRYLSEKIEFVAVEETPENLAAVANRFERFNLPQQQRGISPSWEGMAKQHLSFYREVLRR